MKTAIVFATGLAALIAHPVLAQHPIQFDVKRLTVDSNEGCDIADVDGDGINDVIVSNAHDFSIHLWRGLGKGEDGELQFEEKLIDDSFSQAHCLHLADLDGDGQKEIITGKRVRAHNGGDPGATEPPIMRYYVWNAKTKAYDAHTIDFVKPRWGLGFVAVVVPWCATRPRALV